MKDTITIKELSDIFKVVESEFKDSINLHQYEIHGALMALSKVRGLIKGTVTNKNSMDVVEGAFSFDDLEVWGSNSGATGIVFNVPEPGRESVCLKHIPTGKIGYIELNT